MELTLMKPSEKELPVYSVPDPSGSNAIKQGLDASMCGKRGPEPATSLPEGMVCSGNL